MKKTIRFVIWICSKLTRKEIEQIIQSLIKVLANCNPEVKPKDGFKEKHPNYHNFFVDPKPPHKTPPQKALKLNWKELLSNYEKEKHSLFPVNNKYPEIKTLKGSLWRDCGTSEEYLYFNDITMAKNAHSLNVKSVLLYRNFIFAIETKLNIFVPIMAIHFIPGKNEKMSLSINMTTIDAHSL